ncbi:hypothetical protein EJ04DRAFT_579444 [Polyplosphaeria fusca]|uniref:NACHT domain-containing protein n=1 Tax=Polyplosphaeria fusca TaxID=682080 RepID=A0A9P4QNX6_9PLEO|nr:hypothetical protein EJ04DRAFT_579444 [Polyplosphaeria fusca]
MDPLSALGIASNIIQIVDFSSRIISRGHEIYTSADGQVKDHAILDDAAKNLAELYRDLQVYGKTDSHKATNADKQLVTLRKECESIVKSLRQALSKARLKSSSRKWQSIYQALRSVWNEKEISALATQLENVRRQIDTALLVSLRQGIDELAKHRTLSQSMVLGDESSQRHAEIVNAIRENNWQPSNRSDVHHFAEQIGSGATADLEARFCNMVLARLYFRHMPDRVESIAEAHSETFEWIFRSQRSPLESPSWDSFTGWLQRDDSSIYWITGKPGSGKSTLMKFLYGHDRLPRLLGAWAKQHPLTKAGFYFWNSGAALQMSSLGLFQTLLHTCLSGQNELIISLFPDRWEQFVAFGGGREPFEWPELRRSFEKVISDSTRRFFLLIDGLDEFDGESKEIIDLVLSAARPNVKLCVASRPWLPFEDAFKNRPNLLLERLTRADISTYVRKHFGQNEHYLRLHQHEPAAATAILQAIVGKASGVFLWVYLVVQSLLEGLSNSDRVSHLQARLDALPSDLEALFDKLLYRLEPEYFKQACQTFRLLRAYHDTTLKTDHFGDENPTLLGLYYADDTDVRSSLRAVCLPDNTDNAFGKIHDMERRLNARCRGFIEVSSDKHITTKFFEQSVSYLHRTARDFVESENYWQTVLEATGYDKFNPYERWANANLWLQKTHPQITTGDYHSNKFKLRCIDSALTLQKNTGFVQKTYLDEFCNAHSLYNFAERKKSTRHLDFTMEILLSTLQLTGYLIIVLETCDPTERRHSLKTKGSAWTNAITSSRARRSHPSDNEYDFLEIIAYYRAPSSLRWMRKKPILPPYE